MTFTALVDLGAALALLVFAIIGMATVANLLGDWLRRR